MERDELLAALARSIVARNERDRPLKVAIDGRCASGKSVLADELAAILDRQGWQILRASVDGFHHVRERRYRKGEFSAEGYYEDAFNYVALADCLLAPLSGTAFPALCYPVAHDVRTEIQVSASAVTVDAAAILLFDGVFLFRHEVDSFWDVRILLDVDGPTSISRAVARDGGVIGAADIVRRKYELRYEPAWQIYVEREQPESKAEVIVDNRDFLRPRFLNQRAISDETTFSVRARHAAVRRHRV